MSKPLFDDSDNGSETDFDLKTNKDYAKSYNHLRKKELLQKFKDKGLDATDSDSSDDSDSTEDEILDPTFDQEFLKTLASLKSKDPTIYNKNTKFFENTNAFANTEDNTEPKKKTEKLKPVTVKDYERNVILENEGKYIDDSDSDETTKKNPFRPESPTLAEEERRLKAEFKKVVKDDESSDEEFGGIFKKRVKTKAEQDIEEEDYLKWLAGKKDTIADETKEKLKPLKNYWSNDKLPSSEKFLRDYILNKGYTEASNYSEIPTYEEIVGDNAPLSEDEQELERQAEFEHKFNFRFEEPDQEFIKRYPRTVESTVRRTDDKRKQKRLEHKERKQQEKSQKLKELEMVKEMKRKEIEEKISKLKMVTGNDELAFKDDDLEEDFDPEAHDRRMQELFNDDYYQVDEGEEKPECPSDIEELKVQNWDNYDPNQDWYADDDDYEPHCEDEDFNMDCEYDPAVAREKLQKELIENTKKRKGRKGRRDRFMEMIKTEKPAFDPEDERTYAEYIDEYYQLDCEDIIGDLPCRFKYVETTPNDFGLTVEEILLAKNKELNQWASLKKAVQIRPEQVEKKEQRIYKLKGKNEDLKRKIFKSLYGEEGSEDEANDSGAINDIVETRSHAQVAVAKDTTEVKINKKRRKRKNKNTDGNTVPENNVPVKEPMNKKSKKASLKSPIEFDEFVPGEPMGDINKKVQKQSQHSDNGAKPTMEKPVVKVSPLDRKSDIEHKKPTLQNKSKQKSNPFSSKSNLNKSDNPNPFSNKKSAKSSSPQAQRNPNNGTPKFNQKNKTFNRPPEGSINQNTNISDERLKAYGINPKKFHKKQKYQLSGQSKKNKNIQ